MVYKLWFLKAMRALNVLIRFLSLVCKEQLRTEKTAVQILSVYFLEFYSKIKYTQRAKNIMNSHADHHYQHFSRSVFFLLFN